MPAFGFDNTYARQLAGFYVACAPVAAPAPRLLFLNDALAGELGLDASAWRGDAGAALFAGNTLPDDAEPIAQAYAGHQFGGFSPQLGDGRALLIGELVDRGGRRRDVAFKGSGRTPFSRGGDGRAAVGPMLREVLIGEAMHALGIPTTRALAVAATGESVYRETVLPGAVLTRVAASHLRVGTFQFFAARRDPVALQRLADYAIARHDPALAERPDRYRALLEAVARRQAALIAQWMNVGFIHGVMNTDNMTISGETIDYGPCAFMEAVDPAAVFSSIDRDGRYAYGNQPAIARWNLARLAETLLPLMASQVAAGDGPVSGDADADADAGATDAADAGDGPTAADEARAERALADATAVIDAFPSWYADALLDGQRAKLGIAAATAADADADTALAADWLALLHDRAIDHTQAWRRLAGAIEPATIGDAALHALFGEAADTAGLDGWLARWRERLARDDAAAAAAAGRASGDAARASDGGRAGRMLRANPAVIPRNHRVEEALAAATAGDLAPFEALLAALRRPYDDDPALARYAEPAEPAVTAGYRTFCGT